MYRWSLLSVGEVFSTQMRCIEDARTAKEDESSRLMTMIAVE
jgi:hypothetical protein